MFNKLFVVFLASASSIPAFTLPKDVLYAPIPSDFYDCRVKSHLPNNKNPVLYSFSTDIIDFIISKQPQTAIKPLQTNFYSWAADVRDTAGKLHTAMLYWELDPTSTGQFSQVIDILTSDVSLCCSEA